MSRVSHIRLAVALLLLLGIAFAACAVVVGLTTTSEEGLLVGRVEGYALADDEIRHGNFWPWAAASAACTVAALVIAWRGASASRE
jgi:predicted lysophospholipase L1 biosynthesis ABC-type transport system permease subunit